jgi:hypothetical protein
MNLANADTLAPIMKVRRSERHERGELFVLIRKSKKPEKLAQDNADVQRRPQGGRTRLLSGGRPNVQLNSEQV